MLTEQSMATSVIIGALIVLVLACSITDIRSRRIPNQFLMIALSLALVCHGLAGGIDGLFDSSLGLVIGMVMLLPLYMLGGTGAGDVKLLGTVGALLGAQGAFVAGVATFICGGILGGAWILWRLFDRHVAPHFWHLSAMNNPGMAPLNNSLEPMKLRGASFPYAPAIAGGSILAVWYLGLLGPLTL